MCCFITQGRVQLEVIFYFLHICKLCVHTQLFFTRISKALFHIHTLEFVRVFCLFVFCLFVLFVFLQIQIQYVHELLPKHKR